MLRNAKIFNVQNLDETQTIIKSGQNFSNRSFGISTSFLHQINDMNTLITDLAIGQNATSQQTNQNSNVTRPGQQFMEDEYGLDFSQKIKSEYKSVQIALQTKLNNFWRYSPQVTYLWLLTDYAISNGLNSENVPDDGIKENIKTQVDLIPLHFLYEKGGSRLN